MEIELHFLVNQPLVIFRGEETNLPDSSLDLLIYLAVENRSIHDRDVLTRRLYETTKHRDRLRQAALGQMDKAFKDIFIRQSANHSVGYDGSQVWVDVNEFSNIVNTAYSQKPAYSQLLAAYDLYENDFLKDYEPTLYGLKSWITEKRKILQELFHEVLERLVKHEISENLYEEARIHAERWRQSLPDIDLPLQYLLWLTTNMDTHGQTLIYLKELEDLDVSEPRLIGFSPQEWRRILNRKQKPGKEALQLHDEARVEISDLISISSEHLIGRDDVLEDVFEALVSKDETLFVISGPRGIGKTALADVVASTLLQAKLINRIVKVDVTDELNVDQILNVIALQIDKPHLLNFDYKNKNLSIEQYFKSEPTLLIIDQKEAGDFFSADLKSYISYLSQDVRILVCSLKTWSSATNVELKGLQSSAILDLLNTQSGAKSDLSPVVDELFLVTQGSPLTLRLLARAMTITQLSLADLLRQIADLQDDMPIRSSQFEQVLYWCWRQLDHIIRGVLISLVNFDPLEGPNINTLYELHSDLAQQEVDHAIQQLELLGIIEKPDKSAQAAYQWHSLVHDFLLEMDRLSTTGLTPELKSRLQTTFCQLQMRYLSQEYQDFRRLDKRQRNLLHAFDLGFASGLISLDDVNLFLRYLIARGLHNPARQISSQAMEAFKSLVNSSYVELLVNATKLNIKSGDFNTAEQQLNHALAHSTELGDTSHLGDIYHQIANIVKIKGDHKNKDTIQLYDKALFHARKNQNTYLIASILANMGSDAVHQGKYDTAKAYLAESLELAQEIEHVQVIEFATTSLGVIANEQLDFESALRYLTEAQIIARNSGSPERQAFIFLNMGVAYFYSQNFSDAELTLNRGLEIAQQLKHEELIAFIKLSLGKIEAAKGNLMEAERYYKQTLVAAREHDFRRLAVSVLLDIGKLYLQFHNNHFTDSCFRDALLQALELPNHELAVEALFGLGASIVTNTWIVGPDDIKKTIQTIRDKYGPEILQQLQAMPITMNQLLKTEFLFQHGLTNFPDIQNYRLVEALAQITGISDKK